MADATTQGELRALTGARGVAAWWVVLYHLRQSIAGLPGWADAALAKGYLAVDFFFLLSGFVIWLTWHDRVRTEAPRFLVKRVARVWPLHALMLAGAAALAVVLAVHGHADPAFPAAALPLHLLLVQDWGLADPLRWNDPAWSISAEAAAYLLFPLLARAVDWRRWSIPALLAAAAVILAGLALAMHAQPSLGADIARFGVARCLAEFTVGTIVAALWQRRPATAIAPPLLLAVALLAACFAGAAETLAIPAAFAALLLALARSAGRRNNPLEVRAVHWLGAISYATYLSHFLLWKAFKLTLVAHPGPVAASLIALYLLLVLAASALLYHAFERPAQRRVERWLSFARRNEALGRALPGDGHQTRLLG